MDIKFEVNNYRFNVRSSCIIKDKNHKQVILTNMRAVKSHEVFILSGGRLEIMENSGEAITRELEEELGITLNCIKMISIEEIIEKETNFQMIEFVYYAEIDTFDKIKNKDDGLTEAIEASSAYLIFSEKPFRLCNLKNRINFGSAHWFNNQKKMDIFTNNLHHFRSFIIR